MLALSSALLIAFTFGYFKATTSLHYDPTRPIFSFRLTPSDKAAPPPSSSVGFLAREELPPAHASIMTLVSGGMMDDENAPHIPKPDSWRSEKLPQPYEHTTCPAWPDSMRFYFWSTGLTATVVLLMFFYNLHLKLCGHRYGTWWASCRKTFFPRFTWMELFLPFIFLKGKYAWKELLLPFIVLPLTRLKLRSYWQDLWKLTTHIHWIFFRDSYSSPPSPSPPVKKESKSKSTLPRVKSKKLVMTILTALATIGSSNPFELKSGGVLRRDLRRFQGPCGGLDSNKLCNHPKKHQALLTRLQEDNQIFKDTIKDSKVNISSAVLDSGASFTAITRSDLHLVIKGSWRRLDDPIILDGIAGGVTVKWKCRIKFETINEKGEIVRSETTAYYNENLPCMLMSPQAFLHEQYMEAIRNSKPLPKVEDHFSIFRNRVEWHADDRLVITIKYDSSFLPRLQLFTPGASESTLHAFNFSVLNKSNKNLSGPRRVWLKIHHILGHPSMALTKRRSPRDLRLEDILELLPSDWTNLMTVMLLCVKLASMANRLGNLMEPPQLLRILKLRED